MKIVTILKQVPDAEARVRSKDGTLDLSGATFVIDGMDEYGVEEALRIREGGADAEIVALAFGPKRTAEAIRTALAMGVDRAVHVLGDEPLDALATARVLAPLVRDEGADLVFVGGKQADWDSAALGPALAEALGWPHSDWTTSLTLGDGALEVIHDVDDGSETLTLPLPAVVTTQQGLNEPRYPTLPNIMKAKRKTLDTRALDEVAAAAGVSATSTTELRSAVIESRARRNVMIEGDAASAAAELVRRLRDEAKVL
ncbi:electron transfer flavoprotein subunit beta/FixA family protein [soil metagenome]|nr:electron transfer flavoprotein subunit beta/FixA family protein [Trueperaceae bacterium]